MGIIMITHDLGVIAEMCDRVIVMYAGRIMEQADVLSLYKKPLHPYTQGLIKSIPRLDKKKEKLSVIEGTVPNLTEPIKGCRFHPRCSYAKTICREQDPPYKEVSPGRNVACWLMHEEMREVHR